MPCVSCAICRGGSLVCCSIRSLSTGCSLVTLELGDIGQRFAAVEGAGLAKLLQLEIHQLPVHGEGLADVGAAIGQRRIEAVGGKICIIGGGQMVKITALRRFAAQGLRRGEAFIHVFADSVEGLADFFDTRFSHAGGQCLRQTVRQVLRGEDKDRCHAAFDRPSLLTQ